jgi:hypothetical protein
MKVNVEKVFSYFALPMTWTMVVKTSFKNLEKQPTNRLFMASQCHCLTTILSSLGFSIALGD